MNRDEAQKTVIAALLSVAPEADPAAIDPTSSLRDQLDIDSMDFLHFVRALHESVKLDVPERDYPKLATLESSVDYVVARSS